MTIQLEIYFADLIAFVEYQERLWALMPKIEGKDKHYPKIIFWKDQLESGDPDETIEHLGIINLVLLCHQR